MRIRAVVEFDLKFDEDTIPSLEELVAFHNRHKILYNPSPEKSLAYEIKELLEAEHTGLAEYESATVSNVEIVE